MLKIINLKCANCGANLEIKPETTTFACGYCGVSQEVERDGGTISLRLLGDAISRVQIGTDKTAAELAIKRLKEEMQEANRTYQSFVQQRDREINGNINQHFVFTLLTAVIISCALYSASPYLALVALIVIIGTGGYLWYRSNDALENKYNPKIDKQVKYYNELEKKLVKQKAIVDKD